MAAADQSGTARARLARWWPAGRIYYGWTMLTLVSLAQVTSWGVLFYSFAVFLTPMRTDLGWSVAQLTGAYSLALLLTGVAAVPVGRWLDRRGPRLLMSTGSVLAALLVMAWSQVNNLVAFYVVFAGIGLCMAAVLYEPAFQIVAIWFERKRSRALLLLTFIGAFASVVYIPLTGWMVEAYGWRTALLILAALLFILTVPIHVLILRHSPAELGLRPDGATAAPEQSAEAPVLEGMSLSEALRDSGFWWLCAAMVLATMTTMAMAVHFIPFLLDQGYSAAFAAGLAGAVGVLAIPGRLTFTPLGSYVARRYVLAAIFALQAGALLLLIGNSSTLAVIIYVVLFGAGAGALTPARAAIVAEYYGRRHYGSISGGVATAVTGARAAAPISTGLLYTITDSYLPVLWTLVAIALLAAVAAVKARPPNVAK